MYRSGLEKDFIEYCEYEKSVKRWGSEPITIPYTFRLDGKVHNYFPDFIVEKENGEVLLIELKPYAETKKPTPTSNNYAKYTWVKNVDKWSAARVYAKRHGMKFVIITERFFDKK